MKYKNKGESKGAATPEVPMGGYCWKGQVDHPVNRNGGPAGSVSLRGGKKTGARSSKSKLPNYGGKSTYNRNVA